MIIPTEIMAAVRDGDTQMVEHFLDEGGRVNAVDARGMTLLLGSVRCSKVELCRVLLERGADPNETLHPDYNEKKTDLLWVAAYVADGGVLKPPQGGGAAWSASPSGKLFQILLESGAWLIMPTYFNPRGGTGNRIRGTLLARLLFCFGRRVQDDYSVFLEIVTTLLRAGARLESIVEDLATGFDYSASWCLNWALADRPGLAQDEYFIKTRELILGIQEDGSFKRFMRRPHREILRLRSLFSRGRATPPCAIRCRRMRCYGAARQDYAMEFLVKLPDNGVLWNILSFWRASE